MSTCMLTHLEPVCLFPLRTPVNRFALGNLIFDRQHFLYFLPLPQWPWQPSFAPMSTR
jgi:hypothetical protein